MHCPSSNVAHVTRPQALHWLIQPTALNAGVAVLSQKIGLQRAMLLVPACYLLSGIGFFFAHRIQDSQQQKELAQKDTAQIKGSQ